MHVQKTVRVFFGTVEVPIVEEPMTTNKEKNSFVES